MFRPDVAISNENDETFDGSLTNFDELMVWTQTKCVPLVREITFENAEELTEEGLPFLILFHAPDDYDSIKDYKAIVETQLIGEKRKKFSQIFDFFFFFEFLTNASHFCLLFFFFLFSPIENINFLTADGKRFAHPLHHLGKSQSDLPLIAIDSFRHMYLFPRFKDIYQPGKLKQFLADLYSGKLHREFHYGPDPETNAVDGGNDDVKSPTTPPESTFKKLAPSKNRYTLLKDEL